MLESEKGDNWSIFVFQCPINQLCTVLTGLWDVLEQINDIALIPHYTIRGSNSHTRTAVISWRILREEENSVTIDEIVTNKLSESQITPLKEVLFLKYHKWFLDGFEKPVILRGNAMNASELFSWRIIIR